MMLKARQNRQLGVCSLVLLVTAPLLRTTSGQDFSGYGTYTHNYEPGVCSDSGQVGAASATGVRSIAMNAAQAGGGSACGTCVQVSASGSGAGKNPFPSSFVAVVNNICSTCDYGGLDLPASQDGRWEIAWSFTACPGASGSLGMTGRKMLAAG